jgi:uncharacterized damage-inducible protein DinB
MLKKLIRYTEVADERIISTFLGTDKSLPEAEALFSHVLNAQHIWSCRIEGIKPDYERFHVHGKSDFKTLHRQNISILNELADRDPDQIISYAMSDGTPFQDRIADILLQVINHSTYHRAQIATQFRINGIQPPVTDYIALRRANEL